MTKIIKKIKTFNMMSKTIVRVKMINTINMIKMNRMITMIKLIMLMNMMLKLILMIKMILLITSAGNVPSRVVLFMTVGELLPWAACELGIRPTPPVVEMLMRW